KALIVLGGAQAAFAAGANAHSYGGAALGGAMAGAAAGTAIAPGIGTAIGAIGGALLGLFGHAKKAREEMEKLRSEFISSRGGIEALGKAAEHSGISLQKLFDAK